MAGSSSGLAVASTTMKPNQPATEESAPDKPAVLQVRGSAIGPCRPRICARRWRGGESPRMDRHTAASDGGSLS